jgi:uncharacterized membrane protein
MRPQHLTRAPPLAKMQKEYLIEMEDVVVTKNEKGKATPDKVLERLKEFEGKVVKTSLTAEKESDLQAALEKT